MFEVIFYYLISVACVAYGSPGGVVVSGNDYPFLISLQSKKVDFCGGSLITDKFVLTTAECVKENTKLEEVAVRVGSSRWDEGGQYVEVDVDNIVVHPDWNTKTRDGNLAMLPLKEAVTVETAEKVKLTEAGASLPDPGTSVTIPGWGKVNENDEETPIYPRVAQVPFINEETCQDAYKDTEYIDYITANTFCMGPAGNTTGPCPGDSGNPILLNGVQIGIVTFFEKHCDDDGSPGVSVDLRKYRDWIDKTSSGSS